jgi:hypothetical protein
MSSPESQKKYSSTPHGQAARAKARKTYDENNREKRRDQKRDYMRRKRLENPNYCKWK